MIKVDFIINSVKHKLILVPQNPTRAAAGSAQYIFQKRESFQISSLLKIKIITVFKTIFFLYFFL
ncbi:MAG: hypothetical protein ACJAYJ_005079 [Saprospiraceae bacterium]|jgi:hypothetical protein